MTRRERRTLTRQEAMGRTLRALDGLPVADKRAVLHALQALCEGEDANEHVRSGATDVLSISSTPRPRA